MEWFAFWNSILNLHIFKRKEHRVASGLYHVEVHSNEIKVLKRLCKNKRKYYYQVFRGKYYLQVKHRVAVKLSHGWLVVLLASFLSVLADFCRGLAVKQNQLSSFLSQRGKTFCPRESVRTVIKFTMENIIFKWSTGWL